VRIPREPASELAQRLARSPVEAIKGLSTSNVLVCRQPTGKSKAIAHDQMPYGTTQPRAGAPKDDSYRYNKACRCIELGQQHKGTGNGARYLTVFGMGFSSPKDQLLVREKEKASPYS
jgi:hypothetical protein